MARVAVILHERLGNWAGQLRSRLRDRPVRWFETRTGADIDAVLPGLACPVVLIDLSRNLIDGLSDLERLISGSSQPRVLVLDPERHEGAEEIARELGATHVISGFVPPPEVAELIDRWITLASEEGERQGWSRPLSDDSWLDLTERPT